MKIWKQDFTLEGVNQISQQTMLENLGIEFIEFGDDYLMAKMPVNHKTVQPMRLLHGGASVVLAESIGSTASFLCLDDPIRQATVGVEINANHLRSVPEGSTVIGKATPVRLGRTLHVWNIEISNEKAQLICVSRLTCAVVDRRE